MSTGSASAASLAAATFPDAQKGPPEMTQPCYPVFQEGQTLTRDDLTLLRDFLDDRVRQVGLAVGFGINCGLDGLVSATSLTIGPGIAIDQTGEVLTLEIALSFALPPTVAPHTYDFVSTAGSVGGFTAVLVMHEEETAAPDCNEEGCDGHAATTCRTAEIEFVPGRLVVPTFDFSTEPLVRDFGPLTANPTVAAYNALKAALTSRLNVAADPLVSAAAIAKLTGLTMAGADTPAIKNLKAGFLNEVLFGTLELLRCEALTSAACFRNPARPGVALGWVRQVGTSWEWDCAYRHDWEPARGLSMALIGGACGDPCAIARAHLESLITTFELPPPPAPTTPPETFPPVVCWERDRFGRLRKCDDVYVLDPVIDKNWLEREGFLDHVKVWPQYVPREPTKEDLLGNPSVLVLNEAFGRKASVVLPVLEASIEEHGFTPNVTILPVAEARNVSGYVAATGAGVTDRMVLGINADGIVTETGFVPSVFATQDVMSTVPSLTAATEGAIKSNKQLATTVDTHGAQLSAVDEQLKGFAEFQVEAGDKLAGVDSLQNLTERMDRMAALSADAERANTRIDTVLGTKGVIVRDAAYNKALGSVLQNMVVAIQKPDQVGKLEEAVKGLQEFMK